MPSSKIYLFIMHWWPVTLNSIGLAWWLKVIGHNLFFPVCRCSRWCLIPIWRAPWLSHKLANQVTFTNYFTISILFYDLQFFVPKRKEILFSPKKRNFLDLQIFWVSGKIGQNEAKRGTRPWPPHQFGPKWCVTLPTLSKAGALVVTPIHDQELVSSNT